MDTNPDHYTIPELLGILDLDEEDVQPKDIRQITSRHIQRFTAENNPVMVRFFQATQAKLLQYLQDGEDHPYSPDNKQTDDWIENEVLPSKQPDKLTERKDQVDIYDNDHVPMNRNQLGVSNQVSVPVAQDTLNPNLQNVTNRFLNLDSQFRQASGGTESISTDYTMDLSDPLTNVLSLRLYSIQIPYTWYVLDTSIGNTYFWVSNQGNSFQVNMEPGNYFPADFVSTLNQGFATTGFTYSSSSPPPITTYNSNNGKITMSLSGWTDPSGNIVSGITRYEDTFVAENGDPYFTFFDLTVVNGGCSKGKKFNETLGWVMGFRLPLQPIFAGGNTPQGTINLFGTKYLIVVLDDYNQNHLNNGLVGITELSKRLAMPSYYNTSQPYRCVNATTATNQSLNDVGNLSNLRPETITAMGFNPENIFQSLQGDVGAGTIAQLLPSAPRTLTKSQLYTINEISKARSKTISFRSNAPTNSDTFAIIPIKYGSMTTGQLYTELSGQFQDNKRIYFGPVNIDRLRIRLLDDKGNPLDLHGGDWCVTIIAETLYQY
jgi:hypothetical protein